jgi:(p)ppGpp synthase/HD superfamily hydrolase
MNAGLNTAIMIANGAHYGQMYNDEPYIFHVFRVMMMGKTDDERILGALHDVVEDSTITLDELRQVFSPTICDALDAITHRKGESREDYLARCLSNELAARVKSYDNYENLSHLDMVTDEQRRIRLRNKYESEWESIHWAVHMWDRKRGAMA